MAASTKSKAMWAVAATVLVAGPHMLQVTEWLRYQDCPAGVADNIFHVEVGIALISFIAVIAAATVLLTIIFEIATRKEPWIAMWWWFPVAVCVSIMIAASKQSFEQEGLLRIEERLEPVIAGIDRYRQVEGRYPETLEDLVPKYLERIPSTGSCNFRHVAYGAEAEGYQLTIRPSAEFIPFREFVYRSDGQYPSEATKSRRWHLISD